MNGHADLDRNLAVIDDTAVKLSPNESRLFAYLAERASQTVDHDELLQEVFGYAPTVKSRTVITTMQRLRKKVEADPSDPVHLLNVYGRGYRFEPVDTGLVGRADELAEIDRRLKAGRLWVVAPGGFGKSVLARRFATVETESPLWVDLTEVRTDDGLASAVAHALRVPRLEDPGAIHLALTHHTPSLIVLDAAEHLAGDLVPFVQSWSEIAPVLVTSRVPCPGEPTLELGPLRPRDAQRLFARRAPPSLTADRLDPLLDALQGVPLALELTASRLAVFSPEELAAHLDDLGTLLAGGEGRQASMHAVLDWSWRHTPPELRQALGLLTPARRGLAVSDAVALLGVDGLSRLAQLKQWGWVQQDAGRVLLLDPVRQYLERVCDLAGAQRAHRALFARRVQDLEESILAGRAGDFLRDEWANIRAALDSGIAAGDPQAVEIVEAVDSSLFVRPTREALEMLDQAVEMATGPSLARVLLQRANLWMVRASLDAAALDLDRAEATGHATPGLLGLRRGKLLRSLHRYEEAIEVLERAIPQLSGLWQLHGRGELAYALWADGRVDDARQLLRELVVRSQILDAPALRLTSLGNLGALYVDQDQLEQAAAVYQEALEVCDALAPSDNIAKLHNNLGYLSFYAGRSEEAEQHWAELIRLSERWGNRLDLALGQVNLAQIRLTERDWARSDALLRTSLATFEECGATPHAAFAQLSLGRLHALQARWEEAERWWGRAEPHIPAAAAWQLGVERCVARAEQGDPHGALEALAQGAEGTDDGTRAARALAAGFAAAAAIGTGDRAADVAHRAAVHDALRQAEAVRDLGVRHLAERLRDKIGRLR